MPRLQLKSKQKVGDLAALRRPFLILALLSLLVLSGTAGFRFVKETSWLESLYLSVITLTTLGCRDPADSNETMAFVVVYLCLGLSLFSYSLFTLGQSLLDPQFRLEWKRRAMIKKIDSLSGHHIVCGFGRMGQTICEFLDRRKKPFLVIDRDAEVLDNECAPRGWLYLVGDSTDDENLRQAGIESAKALASVLPSDADNTYVVLSARMLNSNLQIVARAGDEKAIEKIERAGATRVISPYSSGGMKMARFMINPSVESFVDVAYEHNTELELIELHLTDNNQLIGKKLAETHFADQGIMILAIRRASGDQLLPPPGSTVFESGDSLFAFGQADRVARFIEQFENYNHSEV